MSERIGSPERSQTIEFFSALYRRLASLFTAPNRQPSEPRPTVSRRRLATFSFCMVAGFLAVGVQMARFGIEGQRPAITQHAVQRAQQSFARPDITDRNGRLLATDLVMHSAFVDPRRLIDPDAAAFKLAPLVEGATVDDLKREFANRGRAFVWLDRRLSPRAAQNLRDTSIYGLGFQDELHRIYPARNIASHILGTVDIDNKGTLGIEKYIDTEIGIDAMDPPNRSRRRPVALSIDLSAQHALRTELRDAQTRHGARAAAAAIMDIRTGELLAAVSIPDFDPNHSEEADVKAHINRLSRERFELGSVVKTFTLAAVLDAGVVAPTTKLDASAAIELGNAEITDPYGPPGEISVAQAFLKSSNIGTARMVERLGPQAFADAMTRFGLTEPMRTEVGRMVAPALPPRWDMLHTMTASFGHGIAIAPLQLLASAAGILNGGTPVQPTFIRQNQGLFARTARTRREPIDGADEPLVTPATTAKVLWLMRQNVMGPVGTGKRARVPGLEIGGKTGTAEVPTKTGYDKNRVISSFLAAVPATQPRYVSLVVLFEPQLTAANEGHRGAGHTAAPATARIWTRLAPILGLYGDGVPAN